MNFTSGINTIHLEIPALRERPEDIIPLAERFITRFCKQYGKSPLRLDNAAREKLMLHPWFGNIRELEHAIEKAVIICDGTFLSAGLFQLQRRNENTGNARIHPRRHGKANDTPDAGQVRRQSFGRSLSTGHYPADTLQ